MEALAAPGAEAMNADGVNSAGALADSWTI
jgi:hypothetical protein